MRRFFGAALTTPMVLPSRKLLVPLAVPLAGVAVALALPSAARAGSCEDSFTQKGNPLSGTRFSAEVTVDALTVPVAIRQLRGIAATRGYDILSEEADDGSMLLEQPRSGSARPFPIIATAQAEQAAARVKLEAKLPAGMLAGAVGRATNSAPC